MNKFTYYSLSVMIQVEMGELIELRSHEGQQLLNDVIANAWPYQSYLHVSLVIDIKDYSNEIYYVNLGYLCIVENFKLRISFHFSGFKARYCSFNIIRGYGR